MAGYTKVVRSIWQDDEFRALCQTAQRSYFMLISQPDLSQCGILAFTPGRWGALSGDSSAATVRSDIDDLVAAGFVVVDADTEELWIRSYMKYDEGYRVPNIGKAVVTACEAISSRTLRRVAATTARTLGLTLSSTLERTLTESLQPITVPTTAAAAEPAGEAEADDFDGAMTDAVAAAALSMLLEMRVATARTNPGGLRAHLRKELPKEWGDKIAKHLKWHPEATAADLARDVLGVPGIGDPTPPPRPPEPEWHFDPHCHEHASDGMVTVYVGTAGYPERCTCGRAEPYPPTAAEPELLATVTTLHRKDSA